LDANFINVCCQRRHINYVAISLDCASMAVAVLNMHKEKKTYRFCVRQLLRRRDQLNAYDDLLLRLWRNRQQHRRSTCGLNKNISQRFWISCGTWQLSHM